jgi:diguanylate cyclase (GGDEF)-like protein
MENCRVLIVEDEAIVANDISMTLQHYGYSVVDMVSTAEESIRAVQEKKPDVVIMDIVLQNGIDGINIAETIRNIYNIPVIFLTSFDEEHIIERAATQIPFGYILKPFRNKELNIIIELTRQRHRFEHYLQQKSIMLTRELVKSKDMERKLQEISLVDELTGVFNRRGFYHVALQQMEIAKRTKKGLLFCFFDMDSLKDINDTFGHNAGDQALRSATLILKKLFRGSDIISRWGGDEFMVLMINAECEDMKSIEDRIIRSINDYNDSAEHQFVISMSWGMVKYDPAFPMEIEEVITRSDELMYKNKADKKL